MLDTMGPTVSVYIYFYMLYTSLLLAKSNWFTSNIGKLSYMMMVMMTIVMMIIMVMMMMMMMIVIRW